MISIGNALATGAKALAFAALNKFDTLNSIVNRLSGGKVNRDTLAQSVLRGALHLGTEVAVASKPLGERSAVLIPLARDALIDNDLGRMKSAVEGLVREGLSSVMDKDSGSTLAQIGKGMLEQVATKAASGVGTAVLGDHAVEKVVATLVKTHGWQPLESFLNKNLEAYPGGRFIAGQVKAILQRTMVDKPEFDQSANAEYRLMAGALNQFLTGEADYIKPLRDYAPTLTAIGEGLHHYVTEQVPEGVDSLQRALVGQPATVEVHEAYAKAIETAKQAPPEEPLPPPLDPSKLSDDTRDRDVAEKLVQTMVVAEATGKPVASTEDLHEVLDQVHEQGKLSEARHEQLTDLVDSLSPEQIKPLGERGEVVVAHNWSGRLDRVETASHSITSLGEDMAEATRQVLANAPAKTVQVGGYTVAEGYGQQVGELDLQLPANQYGYSDTVLEGSKTLLSAGWGLVGGWMGYDTSTGPTHAQSTELKQLYNTCGGNEEVLSLVSRYLDPALAKTALVAPVLTRMQNAETGLFDTGTARLQLKDPENPHYQFRVQRDSENLISISLTASWPIEQFGPDAEHLRQPEGSSASQMSATAVITVRLNEEGVPPTVNHYPMGVVATVNNVVAFDLHSGERRVD